MPARRDRAVRIRSRCRPARRPRSRPAGPAITDSSRAYRWPRHCHHPASRKPPPTSPASSTPGTRQSLNGLPARVAGSARSDDPSGAAASSTPPTRPVTPVTSSNATSARRATPGRRTADDRTGPAMAGEPRNATHIPDPARPDGPGKGRKSRPRVLIPTHQARYLVILRACASRSAESWLLPHSPVDAGDVSVRPPAAAPCSLNRQTASAAGGYTPRLRRPAAGQPPGAVHPVRKQRRGQVTFASTFCARIWA